MMNKGFLLYVLLLLVWSCARPAAAQELRFAPLPMEQKEKVLHQITPMLHYLEKPLGHHFSINYYENYADILQDFQEKKIDLAFLGPLPYVQLRKKYPDAEPVVRFLDRDGKDTYTCSLITGIESGLSTVAALKGKHLGLTQPHSTCGYLSSNFLLQQVDLTVEDTEFRYTGSHQEVALAVVRGEFDAGGIKTSIAKQYAHLGLRFLAESKSFPGFLLVANKQTLPPEQIAIIRNTLLQLRPLDNTAHAAETKTWGKNVRYGTTEAQDNDYDVIRKQLQGITIPTRGNF